MARSTDALNGVVFRGLGSGKDLRHHGLFGGSEDIDGDMAGGVNTGVSEGHTPGVFLHNVVGDNEAVMDV